MEEDRWPPTLVIPEHILDPILHTTYLIKSLKSEEYLQHNTSEALGIEQALDMLIETCKTAEGRFRLGCVKFLPVVVELVRFMTSENPSTHYPKYANGLVEDWLQELLDTVCLKGSYFVPLFKELRMRFDTSIDAAVSSFKKLDDLKVGDIRDAHVYLLYLLYTRLNRKKRSVSKVSKDQTGLISINPLDVNLKHKNSSAAELLRHSLNILCHFYAHDLRNLGLPRKSNQQNLPFCLDGRKHVQDEIRQKGAMLLLLQQCFEDENDPTRRLTGLMTVAKLLDGNKENQDALKELKKTEYLPKFAGIGPGVKIDPTGHAIFTIRLE
ncbi:hypothetical protein MKW92_012076 [Papaver armeniacum]|nr:hypothetical protein MKW92_012076 [Papaver armeniacum]